MSRRRSNLGRHTRNGMRKYKKRKMMRKLASTQRSLASCIGLAFQYDPTANYRVDDNLDIGLLTTVKNEEIGQQSEICENFIKKELQTEDILNDEDCLQKFLESDITIEDCKKELCEDQIQCLECNESFPDEENLKSHLNTNSNCSRYKCYLCDKIESKNHLNIHMLQHTEERPYKCVYCDKSYVYLQTLLSHMKKHSDRAIISPIECMVCKKQFFKKYNLDQHLLTHTNERPYRCEVCSKHFKSLTVLRTHLKMHSNEKLFECNICNKSFAYYYQLKSHTEQYIVGEPYQCNLCQQSFKFINELQAHKKEHVDTTILKDSSNE